MDPEHATTVQEYPHGIGGFAERLDRLRWSRIHTRIAIALGIAWILDGFETTIVGPILGLLAGQLHFDLHAAAWINPIYTIGMLAGALIFGPLADALGRKRLFLVTLALYAGATVLTGFAWDFRSLALFRFLTGIGIGGEYAAINSAVDEFVPARYRGRADGLINASWNVGVIVASSLAIVAFTGDLGERWRWVFWAGALTAVAVMLVRVIVPESPRWLAARGKTAQAEIVVRAIEARARVHPNGHAGDRNGASETADAAPPRRFHAQVAELLRAYPQRTIFSWVVNLAQVSPYYGLVAIAGIALFPALGVPPHDVPLLYLAGAIGGLGGQILTALGVDAWGRRPVMLVAFAAAGLLALVLGHVHTLPLFVAVFVAFSAASGATGSGAYVLISELFPTELRASGIGLSVAVGRIGAIISPIAFYALFSHAGAGAVYAGMASIFAVGAAAMMWWLRFGVEGRGRSLEAMLETGVR
jgi:MFS family permease